MPTMKFQFEIEGVQELIAHLQSLGQAKKLKSVLRNAVTFASTPILHTARMLAARDSGQLHRSISKVVRTYPSGVSVAVVGPAKGFRAHVPTKSGRLALRNPVKYAHLIEYGHRIAQGGKLNRSKYASAVAPGKGRHAGDVAAKPFMLPAYLNNRGIVQQRLEESIGKGLAKIAEKNAKAGTV